MERTPAEKREELERELRIAREALVRIELEECGAPCVPAELLDMRPHLTQMESEQLQEYIDRVKEDLDTLARSQERECR